MVVEIFHYFVTIIQPFHDMRLFTGLFLTLTLFFASCTHYYYGPNTSNVVLLKERELKINAGFAAGDEFNGFELQSAVAFSPHLGLMVNGVIGSGKGENNFDDNDESGSARFVEAGVGYFKPLENNAFIFEIFGGVGFGGVNNIYSFLKKSKVSYSRYFIQPGFGFRDDNFEWGFSSRFSYVQHNLVSSNVTSDQNPEEFLDIMHLQAEPNSFLWEPGVVFRFGGPKLKGQMQYTYSVNLTNPELQQERGLFNVGISIPVSL